jgi:hypothetical protein
VCDGEFVEPAIVTVVEESSSKLRTEIRNFESMHEVIVENILAQLVEIAVEFESFEFQVIWIRYASEARKGVEKCEAVCTI